MATNLVDKAKQKQKTFNWRTFKIGSVSFTSLLCNVGCDFSDCSVGKITC